MIIDFHTHIFPEKVASTALCSLTKTSGAIPHTDGSAAALVAELDAAGADLAINLPVLTAPSQFASITRFAEAVNRKEIGGGRILSFGGIHPQDSDIEAHIEELADLGFLGIKIHPDFQNTFIDDEAYFNIFRAAARRRLIIVTHAGQDDSHRGKEIKCTPKRVLRLLDRLGGYDRLVLAHNGGHELFDSVLKNLAGEDIYFDTGYNLSLLEKDKFLKLIEKHSPKKILFATDSPWRSIKSEVELIRSFELGGELEELIFEKNARTLLNLT